MPLASTSAQTLDSSAASASSAAGFRAPSKRSASRRASLCISRSRAKGKERAQDEDEGFAEWDEGDEGEGGYAPKARQLKVRKRRRSEGGDEGQGAKRRKAGDDEPPEVVEKSKKERSKRKKGKEKAVDAPDKPKKESKKRVRIATPAPASSDGAGTDYSPSDVPSSDGDLPPQALDGASLSSDDWTDPLGIPSAQTVRGRKYWRLLEQGIYRSALHDAAGEGMDLGRALVQWEGLRRRREEEEEVAEEEWRALQQKEGGGHVEAKTRRDDAAADEDESQAGTPAPGGAKKRRSAKAPHDPYRSLHPFPLSRDPKADEDGNDPRHRLEYDDSDGAEVLPLPSSVALAKMARWPVHSSVLGAAFGTDSLEDALEAEYERVHRRTRPDPVPRLRRRGPRSAYGPDGPFAPSSPSAQPDSDSSSDADSDPLDSDADSPSPPPSLLALPSLLSQILTRLADCIAKSPFPAYEYWSTRERDEEGRKEDARRGVEREERGVGWEEVVSVASEVGVDESIVNTLSAQLVALFGPSRHPPVTLGPPGGYPSIQPQRRQVKSRARKKASKVDGHVFGSFCVDEKDRKLTLVETSRDAQQQDDGAEGAAARAGSAAATGANDSNADDDADEV
ncbi:hypothetical protein JCM10296v2_003064 [Rhodotorula toruloides]